MPYARILSSKSMFTQFRIIYPNGGLISELVAVDHGQYIIRTLVQDQGVTLATGLAAADTVEAAEDRSRIRALEVLDLENMAAIRASTSPQTQANVTPMAAAETTPHQESYWDNGSQFDLNAELPTAVSNHYPSTQPTPSQELGHTYPSSVTPQSHSQDVFSKPQNYKQSPPDQFSREDTIPEITNNSLFEQPLPNTETVSAPPKKGKKTKQTASTPKINISPQDPRIEQIDREMSRLGWTTPQGKEYLLGHYGKRSRGHLTDEELQEFLDHLQSLPT